jgi:hypothetical protein
MFMATHLVGFGGFDAGGTRQTVLSNTLSDNTTHTWSGYTARMFIPQASLGVTGGTQVWLSLKANSSDAISIASMYVQRAAAGYSATSPAFDATPVQVLFSGVASVTVSANTTTISDAATLAIPTSQGLLISFHISDATNIRFPTNTTTPAAAIMSYKNASDAATVAASGYTDFSGTTKIGLISLIEVLA